MVSLMIEEKMYHPSSLSYPYTKAGIKDKKKIAIDLEDVLANVKEPYIRVINERYGTNYTVQDITSWDFRCIGSSLEEFLAITRILWKYPEEIPPTEPYLGRKIDALREMGYEIHIITQRPDSHEEMKQWLILNGIEYDEFLHTNHLKESKLGIIKANNYLYVIDDNPNLAQEIKNVRNTLLLLYDQPWNRSVKETENIIRVPNFGAAIEIVETFEKLEEYLMQGEIIIMR